MVPPGSEIAIGSFLNLTALSGWITEKEKNVILFCAGWKNRFNIEDTVCAGAIAEKSSTTGMYSTICDSTKAAIDLWSIAESDPHRYIQKVAQRTRLGSRGTG